MPPIRIRLRRDEAVDWVKANPVLAPGEPGFETDTGRLKIGDGLRKWNLLPYFHPGDDAELFATINAHIQSLQAQNVDEAALHAAIVAQVNELRNAVIDDDGPSLFLLYENAKV